MYRRSFRIIMENSFKQQICYIVICRYHIPFKNDREIRRFKHPDKKCICNTTLIQLIQSTVKSLIVTQSGFYSS